MKCEVCQQPREGKGSIVNGIYYSHICVPCYDRLLQGQTVSSGQAAYNRDRDFEDHEADIRQPYSNGQADKEFIRLYPEQARQMFSAEEIKAAERA